MPGGFGFANTDAICADDRWESVLSCRALDILLSCGLSARAVRRTSNRCRNLQAPVVRTDMTLSDVSHCFWNKICCVSGAGTRVLMTSSHWRGEAMTMLSESDSISERRPCETTSSAKPVTSVQLTDEEWFRRSGRVAMSIGHDGFHRELVDLFGVAIPHEFELDNPVFTRRAAGRSLHAQRSR